MKAVTVREFRSFDQAQIEELPDPTPREGEVIVDIHASDVNFPDILYIEGKYQKLPDFPFSPGLAGAGIVSGVGDGVTEFRTGAKVLVLPEYGTYAEKVAVPADFCFAIPNDVSFDAAAALGLVYQTAYFALTARARLERDETVLVLGATGGVGMAAVQLAKALGAAKVIAATRGEDGAKMARKLGADATVDTAHEDLRQNLRDIVNAETNGHGADVVIDPVGGDTALAALRAMAWCGRLVVIGFASGDIPKFGGNYLLVKNISILGLQWTDYRARRIGAVRDAQAHIFRLWQEGSVAPIISDRVPFERYADGLAALKAGKASGKIILTTQPEKE